MKKDKGLERLSEYIYCHELCERVNTLQAKTSLESESALAAQSDNVRRSSDSGPEYSEKYGDPERLG